MKKIEELREELRRLEALEEESRQLKSIERNKRWNEAVRDSSNYTYRVAKHTRRLWCEEEPTEGCFIERKMKPSIVKKLDLKDILRSEEWAGLFYYRTEENILMYSGGGTHVLKVPRLCNDEEWEKMQQGDIPEKFKL
jgi:hypothetical protein